MVHLKPAPLKFYERLPPGTMRPSRYVHDNATGQPVLVAREPIAGDVKHSTDGGAVQVIDGRVVAQFAPGALIAIAETPMPTGTIRTIPCVRCGAYHHTHAENLACHENESLRPAVAQGRSPYFEVERMRLASSDKLEPGEHVYVLNLGPHVPDRAVRSIRDSLYKQGIKALVVCLPPEDVSVLKLPLANEEVAEALTGAKRAQDNAETFAVALRELYGLPETATPSEVYLAARKNFYGAERTAVGLDVPRGPHVGIDDPTETP